MAIFTLLCNYSSQTTFISSEYKLRKSSASNSFRINMHNFLPNYVQLKESKMLTLTHHVPFIFEKKKLQKIKKFLFCDKAFLTETRIWILTGLLWKKNFWVGGTMLANKALVIYGWLPEVGCAHHDNVWISPSQNLHEPSSCRFSAYRIL